MAPRGKQRKPKDISPWRLLLVLLALFAATTQQLVAQTHWHAATTVLADAGAGSSSQPDGAGRHDDCLLCQIAAHASAAAPPVVQQPLPVLRAFVSPVPSEHRSVVVPKPAHAWQSRGPPTV